MWIFSLIDYTTGTPVTTGIENPIGWEKMIIKYARDTKYHGFFDFLDDSFSGLDFNDQPGSPAFSILKNAYDTNGADAHIEINLQYKCNISSPTIDIYTSKFDFACYKMRQSLEGCFIDIAALTSSAYYNFKNRIDQAVDLNSLVSFDKALAVNQTILQAELIIVQKAYQAYSASFDDLLGEAQADLSGCGFCTTGYAIVACVAALQAVVISGSPQLSGDNAILAQATSFGLSEQEASDAPTAAAIAAAASAIQTTINGLISPTCEDIAQVITDYIHVNALGSVTRTTATDVFSAFNSYTIVYSAYYDTADLPPYPGLGFELQLLSKQIAYSEFWFGAEEGALDSYCGIFQPNLSDPFDKILDGILLFPGVLLQWDDISGGSNQPSVGTGGHTPPDPTLTPFAPTAPMWTAPNDYDSTDPIDVRYNFVGTFNDILFGNGSSTVADCSGTELDGFRGILANGQGNTWIELRLSIQNATGTAFRFVTLGSFNISTYTSADSGIFDFTIQGSQSVTFDAGDRIWLTWYFSYQKPIGMVSPPSYLSIQWNFSYTAKQIYFRHLTSFPDSTGQVFMVNEAFSRISESLTGQELKVYSDFFGRPDALPYASVVDGCGALECISNGRFIRQAIVAANGTLATMGISFTDLFSDMNAIHRLGMGIEPDPNRTGKQRLRIESEDYFYNDTVIFTCPNVTLLETDKDTANDWAIVHLGYPNWQCWEINGLDEFNTERHYRTTLNSSNNTKDLTCKSVLSGYAIEFTRRQGGGSSDWRYDSMNFIICLNRSGGYTSSLEIDGSNIHASDAENMLPEGIAISYNARISPARIALNHIRGIFRCYQDYKNGKLIYTWGDGNYLAAFQPNNDALWHCMKDYGVLGESQLIDYSIFNFPGDNYPLFKNELVRFEYPVTITEFLTLQANPYGKIGYSVLGGDIQYGWIEQMSYTPQTDGSSHAFIGKFVLKPAI